MPWIFRGTYFKSKIMSLLMIATNKEWDLHKHMKVSDLKIKVKKGNMLHLTLKPDVPTTLYVAQKITNIEKDGTIRIECVDSKCKKEECTYLNLYNHEIGKVYITKKYRKTRKLGGLTF